MSGGGDLRRVAPRWVQLVDDQDGLAVVELDDAAADGAPWPDFPLQLAVALALHDPDPTGQPYAGEHAELVAWQAALEAALGDDGRVVATITMDGVRELVGYLTSADVVASWDDAPPEGLASHAAEVDLVVDPRWRGLREIAGLLDGEPPLPPAARAPR